MSFEFKRIAHEEVADAEVIPQFKGIRSWDQLYSTFDRLTLKTSAGADFTREDLDEGINVARETNFAYFRNITSSEGLREAVACLLLPEAKNFEELSNILKQITAIEGSQKVYTQAELLENIQSVLNGAGPEILTNTFGLRSTVVRLQSELHT